MSETRERVCECATTVRNQFPGGVCKLCRRPTFPAYTLAERAEIERSADARKARALVDYGDAILKLDLEVSYYDHNDLPDTPRIRAARAVVDAIRRFEAASNEGVTQP